MIRWNLCSNTFSQQIQWCRHQKRGTPYEEWWNRIYTWEWGTADHRGPSRSRAYKDLWQKGRKRDSLGSRSGSLEPPCACTFPICRKDPWGKWVWDHAPRLCQRYGIWTPALRYGWMLVPVKGHAGYLCGLSLPFWAGDRASAYGADHWSDVESKKSWFRGAPFYDRRPSGLSGTWGKDHLRLYIGATPASTWRSCSASNSSGVQKHLYAKPRSNNSWVYLR